jgi:hypothetical protein
MDKANVLERIKLTRSMMDHPGWIGMTRDWSDEVELIKATLVNQRIDEYTTGIVRGKLDVLSRLLNLAKLMDAVEQSILDPEGEDEADA